VILRIQDPADSFGEVSNGERFHHKGPNSHFAGLMFRDPLVEPGHDNDRNIRPKLHHCSSKIRSRHSGHGVVSNDQVKVVWLLTEENQCVKAVGHGADPIAKVFEHLLAGMCQLLFIIHQQYSFPASGDLTETHRL